MINKLQEEIRQTRPFGSLEEEALLNIRRTSDRMQYSAQQAFKPLGVTLTQYNVLRILRGAGDHGLRCSEIGDRLVSSDPDITRLLARLQKQKLIRRRRDPKDRRVVHATITTDGLKLLGEADPVVDHNVRGMLGHMSPDKLSVLVNLLEEARQNL
jgi:DNA-binding MarR family transcriptional regulator